MKQKFTKANVDSFISKICADNKLASEDILEIIELTAQSIQYTIECPRYPEIDDLLFDYLTNPEFDMSIFEPEDVTAGHIKVKNVFDRSVWKKTPEVLNNFDTICSNIESYDEQASKRLLDTLKLTGKDINVGKGNMCHPAKSIANMDIKVKVPAGFVIVETRVNTRTNTEYRVYGFLETATNTIYNVSAYTKNAGQAIANKEFDKAIVACADYIKNNLVESFEIPGLLSYNILEENIVEVFGIMESFEQLNSIGEVNLIEEELRGWNDYMSGKLLEDNASDEYTRGYESAKAQKSVDDIRAYGIEHRAELLKTYKERKNLESQ